MVNENLSVYVTIDNYDDVEVEHVNYTYIDKGFYIIVSDNGNERDMIPINRIVDIHEERNVRV